jgi:uncharacterized protein
VARMRMVGEATSLTEPFWEATKRKELVLQWCERCDKPVHRPRERCPRCMTSELTWRPASGAGELYAVSVSHRQWPTGPPGDGPYVVALVDLDEGARMMSNVIGMDPESVEVGMRVKVAWEPLEDGRNLPQFEVVST